MSDEKGIELTEILWPYRPDILIRVDFLRWFEEIDGMAAFDSEKRLTPEDVNADKEFFEKAKNHPYFLQFTRKYRSIKLNVPKSESEPVYAEGIASFINLFHSIKQNGFDYNNEIELIKPLILARPNYGEKIVRRYYIGDGCHRFACLILLNRALVYANECFQIRRKFVHKPINTFGVLKRLQIFTEEDEREFNRLVRRHDQDRLEDLFEWIKRVRERFGDTNIDRLFDIRFETWF